MTRMELFLIYITCINSILLRVLKNIYMPFTVYNNDEAPTLPAEFLYSWLLLVLLMKIQELQFTNRIG